MSYDPEIWLESATRELKAYVEDYLAPPLDQAYEVIMEFPSAVFKQRKVPLERTLIHFEIDDMPSRAMGFGENTFATNYDAATHTVNPQEARIEQINFDVGIWAFDRTGGTTARLRTQQILRNLFSGSQAIEKLRTFTDGGDGGLEIISFNGGRFINDTVNDVPVYRSVNGSLEIRVFSRTPLSDTPIPAIENLDQLPGLTIIG